MVGKHCGVSTVAVDENPVYFRRKCVGGCKRIFKQRKRLAAAKLLKKAKAF